MIQNCIKTYETHRSLADLFDLIIEESQYIPHLRRVHHSDGETRVENVMELKTVCLDPKQDLSSLLENLALDPSLDHSEKNKDAVQCMTFHHAKGLEFDTVFMVGMEHGLLPYFKSQKDPQALEEERRLSYVGMTRAESQLYFSGTQERTIFGEVKTRQVSDFIFEIPKSLIECYVSQILNSGFHPIIDTLNMEGMPYKSINSFIKPSSSDGSGGSTQTGLIAGTWVNHKVWGDGQITAIEGSDDAQIYVIKFQGSEKKLMAKYAPLDIINHA